jgi:hypothetical protein
VAHQGFNLDSWALGLCLLHLLTGQPHYEVLETVRCPAMLAEALLDEWNVEGAGKAYR